MINSCSLKNSEKKKRFNAYNLKTFKWQNFKQTRGLRKVLLNGFAKNSYIMFLAMHWSALECTTWYDNAWA